MWQRHDLVLASPAAWLAMLNRNAEMAELPYVAGWAGELRPVIVRRRTVSDPIGCVPAGLPLPPSLGKLRLAFNFPEAIGLTPLSPVSIVSAASAAPTAWKPGLAAIGDLAQATGSSPYVFGGLLWEYMTGLPYLTATSDIDLLWKPDDEEAVWQIVNGLQKIDADSPMRLDGEIILPDGAGVSWRELARGEEGGRDAIFILKTIDRVETRKRHELFDRVPTRP